MNRRGFLSSGAMAAGTFSLMNYLRADEPIAGFDQTATDVDQEKKWEPFSDKKLKVGIVGYGVCRFGAAFEFQNHPNVDIVAVSDLFPDRCAELAKACRCDKQYPSLEEMVKDDSIEAIFCATDAPAHAKHAVLCLEHGKHVCHAVPVFYGDIDDAERLLEAVKKNRGLKYAMFETSAYHDDLYAMEKIFAAGVFGKLVYSEGEYCHPLSIGHPPIDSYKEWRVNGAPLWYPTHASAYYVGVTHGALTEVTAFGAAPFQGEVKPNGAGNVFSSEAAICRTGEGGLFRLVKTNAQGEYLEAGRLRGEYAGYDGHNGRVDGFVGDGVGKERLEKALAEGLSLKKPLLPPSVQAGGHGGSHGYLSNDFVEAILLDRAPRVGILDALNMTVPGYYAHLSATKDGETLKVPQYTLD